MDEYNRCTLTKHQKETPILILFNIRSGQELCYFFNLRDKATKFCPELNQICPELEIDKILFIVAKGLSLHFPFLRAGYKRLQIRSKDTKQSEHSNVAITKRYLGLRQEEILLT